MAPELRERNEASDDWKNRAFIGFMGGLAVSGETSNVGLSEPLSVIAGVAAAVILFKGIKLVKDWLFSDEQ